MHTHEIHLKRLAEGKILAKHILADRDGVPPADGQRGDAEYALNNSDDLADHVKRYMAPIEEEV